MTIKIKKTSLIFYLCAVHIYGVKDTWVIDIIPSPYRFLTLTSNAGPVLLRVHLSGLPKRPVRNQPAEARGHFMSQVFRGHLNSLTTRCVRLTNLSLRVLH